MLDRDGTFRGSTTTRGSYEARLTICDDGNPQLCTAQDLVVTMTNRRLAETGNESLGTLRLATLLMLVGVGLMGGGVGGPTDRSE